MEDVICLPAREQARLIREREISPVELVEASLHRIDRLDGRIGAFITVAAEQALDAARAAEKSVTDGEQLPALHGVPITIKDIEATAGIRTTLGSRVFENLVPDFDSVVVERVRSAGAIIIGKTNTPEIAIHMETVTDNDVRGACHNPWDLTRTTSGSSGGAAAVLAADMSQIAIGSDGGGSIRIPASFCGVFGFKPSNGRVPRARGFGNPDPNQFAQSGPMTNDVRDAAILLQAIAGPHRDDPQQFLREEPPDFASEIGSGVKGMRIGWSPDFGYGAVDRPVLDVVESAVSVFGDLGAKIEESDIALSYDYADQFWQVFGANAYVQYGHLLEESLELLTDGVRRVLTNGKQITGHGYSRALRAVNDLKQLMTSQMTKFDVIITPTTSVTAFKPGERPDVVGGIKVDSVYGVFPFTYICNMTGQPAATVPCGFVDGLPVGMHIIGRTGDEAAVLRVAAAFEEARPWRGVRPPGLNG